MTAGILVIDIGTSSIRANVVSLDGSILGGRTAPTGTVRTAEGGARLDAEQCWRATVDVAAAAAHGHEIVAIGVSAQLGAVAIGRSMRALSPIFLWSDRTAEPQLERVRRARSDPSLPAAGRRITSELVAPRILQLSDEDPGVLEEAAAVVSLKDFLVGKLTGCIATDPTHASYTLLFDIANGRWSTEACTALGIDPELLPPVRTASDEVGALATGPSRDLGLRPGIPVASGGPDGTVGSLGAGAFDAGAAVDIAGSTDVLVRLIDAPVFDAAEIVTTNAHLLADRWTIGGATGLTGGGVDWLAQVVGEADAAAAYARWGDEIDAVSPGAGGARGYTTLTGQRYPYWELADLGGLRGLTPLHRPPELVAAFQEGAAFLVRAGLRETLRFAPAPELVRIVGGIARRPSTLQLRADVLGVPVEGIADGMATSRGAAVLAGLAAGLFGSVGEAVGAICAPGVVFDPEPARQRRYDDIFDSWESGRGNSPTGS